MVAIPEENVDPPPKERETDNEREGERETTREKGRESDNEREGREKTTTPTRHTRTTSTKTTIGRDPQDNVDPPPKKSFFWGGCLMSFFMRNI